MMEETTRSRNGYTLTAASASSASYDSSAESVMAITDIYIVDTLPPTPFDPSLLAGESSNTQMKEQLMFTQPKCR